MTEYGVFTPLVDLRGAPPDNILLVDLMAVDKYEAASAMHLRTDWISGT